LSKKKATKEKFVKPIEILPKNEKQKELIESIKKNVVTVAIGRAGTGKTFLPLMLAAQDLNKGRIESIILTRPNIDSGEPLGFDPGTQTEKLAMWLGEQLKILRFALGDNEVECRLKNGSIQLIPFQKMRGLTFDDAYIILSEAQNTTQKQMEMFTTRIGEQTRVIIEGDITQDDLCTSRTGMMALMQIIEDYGMSIPIIEFGFEDVVRSGITRQFTINWHKWKKQHG
jgi:phosphate starvation-inducible PhoH-like protein